MDRASKWQRGRERMGANEGANEGTNKVVHRGQNEGRNGGTRRPGSTGKKSENIAKLSSVAQFL